MVLYLELAKRLHETIKSSVDLGGNTLAVNDAGEFKTALQIPIAQSALLCFDLLVGKLGHLSEWQDLMSTILTDLLALIKILENALGQYSQVEGFLGAILLCCGTICQGLKAKALPYLSVSNFF